MLPVHRGISGGVCQLAGTWRRAGTGAPALRLSERVVARWSRRSRLRCTDDEVAPGDGSRLAVGQALKVTSIESRRTLASSCVETPECEPGGHESPGWPPS